MKRWCVKWRLCSLKLVVFAYVILIKLMLKGLTLFFKKNVCLNVVVVVSLAYLFLTLSSGGKNSKIGKK